MEQADKQSALLKKARRAVWLNRHLGISIPLEYEKFIVNQECCDAQFMRDYVIKHKLQEANEELFFNMYLSSSDRNLQLAQDYVACHGAYPAGQILIMQSKDVNLIVGLLASIDLHPHHIVSHEAFQVLVELREPQLLYNILKENLRDQTENRYSQPHRYWAICFDLVIQLKSVEMLEVFSNLRFQGSGFHFTAGYEKFLFQEGTDEMISSYFKSWLLFDSTLEYMTGDSLNCDKWENVIKFEIERRELPVPVLFNLVKLEKRELLKEHYQKYGLPPEVLSFYCNQQKFKQDVGL